MICCVCGANRDLKKCVVLKTTDAERDAIRKMGQEPKDEYVYCRPCHRLITDKERGAKLLQGLVQTRLRMAGNPRADEIGKRYYDFLLQKAKGPVS